MRNIALLPAYFAAFLHVGGGLIGAIGSSALEGAVAIVFGAVASGSLVLFLTLWLQGAFLIAEETRPQQARRPQLNWLPFVSPILIAVAVLLGNQSLLGQLCTPVIVVVYWALIYRAAAALVRAEGKVSGGTPDFNAVFVAWLGLAAFPIGIWFLRPRLERLNERLYRAAPTLEAAA